MSGETLWQVLETYGLNGYTLVGLRSNDWWCDWLNGTGEKFVSQNQCIIVFEYKYKRISTTLTLQGQPLKHVSEFFCLGVVLIDSLASNSNLERSKRIFFKQHNSNYQKSSYVHTKVMSNIFTMHVMSFCCIETWFLKLPTKDFTSISVAYHKVFKRICSRISYDSNHECLEYACLPIFKHFPTRKFICFEQGIFIGTIWDINLFLEKSLERFSKEIYLLIIVFDNRMFSRLQFIQRT